MSDKWEYLEKRKLMAQFERWAHNHNWVEIERDEFICSCGAIKFIQFDSTWYAY